MYNYKLLIADILILITGFLTLKMAASGEIRQISKVVALVTGGASGLGRATVARLARQGARVLVADLPDSNGEEMVNSRNVVITPYLFPLI